MRVLHISLLLGALLVAFLPHGSWAAAKIGIYAGPGSWFEDRAALKNFFAAQGVNPEEFANFEMLERFSLVVLPGGWAPNYLPALTPEARKNLVTYLERGGKLIGICAGAFILAKDIVWEGKSYTYGLGIFKGIARGPLHTIAPWPDHRLTPIFHPHGLFHGIYYGGPELLAENKTQVKEIARWASPYHESAAAIIFNFHRGKVLLFGFHPEIGFDNSKGSWDTQGGSGAAWWWLSYVLQTHGFLSK